MYKKNWIYSKKNIKIGYWDTFKFNKICIKCIYDCQFDFQIIHSVNNDNKYWNMYKRRSVVKILFKNAL